MVNYVLRHSDARAVRPYEVGTAYFDTPSMTARMRTQSVVIVAVTSCHDMTTYIINHYVSSRYTQQQCSKHSGRLLGGVEAICISKTPSTYENLVILKKLIGSLFFYSLKISIFASRLITNYD